MYATTKLVYAVQEMTEKKAIEDIKDEETGRMLRELDLAMCFPIYKW